MEWIQHLTKAIDFIECNIINELNAAEIAKQVHSSVSHFQRVFTLVTGITLGDYIRNRRLSLAGQELLCPEASIIKTALKYRYETQESFSKAFTRFHGVNPSKCSGSTQLKYFHPLKINVTLQGGFEMSYGLTDKFVFINWNEIDFNLQADEAYEKIVQWSKEARRHSPNVFKALREWILDDSQWDDSKLFENEQILRQNVFARFKKQNAELRAYLLKIKPSSVVNEAVFKALNMFDNELLVNITVSSNRNEREVLADFIKRLSGCDASLQWTLFLAAGLKEHAKIIDRESFDYIELGKVRFIGKEFSKHPDIKLLTPAESLPELIEMLPECGTENAALCHFEHHNGGDVNVNQCNMMGYFCKAGTPVPEGYSYYDVPHEQAAYAVYYSPDFNGDIFGAAYEFTRNQILGDAEIIPYPKAYWTAEVYPEGYFLGLGEFRFGYMFSTADVENLSHKAIGMHVSLEEQRRKDIAAKQKSEILRENERMEQEKLKPALIEKMNSMVISGSPMNIDLATMVKHNDSNFESKCENGLLIMKAEEARKVNHFATPQKFQTPLKIELRAKTDSADIRLRYGEGRVICNFKNNPSELHLNDIKGGKSVVINNCGQIPVNEFVDIEWLIHKEFMALKVNGELRHIGSNFGYIKEFAWNSEYSISAPVLVCSAYNSTVTVEKLQVTEI